MARLHLAFFAALLALAMAQPAQVRKVSEAQFQRRLTQKLPSNMLISGTNRERGMEAVMRAKRYVAQHGCNTHVCFALDAGVFVSQEEYSIQQDFATLVAAVAAVDERFFVTGVQYGLCKTVLTRLTRDVDMFLGDVDASTAPGEWTQQRRRRWGWKWRKQSRKVFKKTLRFCKRELERGGGLSAKKIIFLGDLRSPRGGVKIAKKFLPPIGNGAICAVGLGQGQQIRLERFTGSPNRVLSPQQAGKALDILEELVRDVCGPSRPEKVNSVFKETNMA